MKTDLEVMARLRANPDFQKLLVALEEQAAEATTILVNAPADKLALAQGMARQAVLIHSVLKG